MGLDAFSKGKCKQLSVSTTKKYRQKYVDGNRYILYIHTQFNY